MTENIDIEAIRAEAKALGVKGWHLMGEERLLEEIEAAKKPAKVEQSARKKAPRMRIEHVRENNRQHKLDELNALYPEYEHQYRLATTDPRKIEHSGFEIVDGEKLGDEIVVRTMKDSFVEWQNKKNKLSTDHMQAAFDDHEGIKILSQTAVGKDPVDKNRK